MLQAIRDRAQGWITWVIVGMIILVFTLFGVSSYFDFNPSKTVAVVEFPSDAWFSDETEIPVSEFEFELRRAQRKDNSLQLLEDIMDQYMLDLVNYHTGLQVGEKQLNRFFGQVFSQEGKFNSVAFEATRQELSSPFMPYQDRVRLYLGRNLFTRSVHESSFTTAGELEKLIKLEQQTRDIAYVIVEKKRFLDKIEVAEDEISKYYTANKQQYKTAEQLSLEYIELNLTDMLSNIPEPDKSEIAERYESYRFRLQDAQPEERRASYIIINIDKADEQGGDAKAKATIDDLYKKISEGGDFAQLAKDYSQDTLTAKEGGDLGYLRAQDAQSIDLVFKQQLFSLKLDELSTPFKNSFGYNIIKLTGLRENAIPPLEKVKDELIDESKQEKAEIEFDIRREELDRLVFEVRNELAPVAKRFALKLQQIGPFDRGRGTGVAALPQVTKALLEEKILNGENSSVIEVSESKLVFIRVTQRTIPALKKLAEVKEQIANKLKQDKGQAMAKALGESIMLRISKGEVAQEVVKAEGLDWTEQGGVKRDDGQVNFSIRRKLFQLARPTEQNKPVYDVVPLFNGDYAVLALYKVQDGDIAKVDKNIIETAKTRLQSRLSMSEWNGAMDDIRANSRRESFPERLR